jgi:two-component system, response regulator / RNA-binding antiterminator
MQLTVARSLWPESQRMAKQLQKAECKLAGLQNFQRTRSIMMSTHGMTGEEAHQTIRWQAISKRALIEEMALAIIHANAFLNLFAKSF